MRSTSEGRGVLDEALELVAAGYSVRDAVSRLILAARGSNVVPIIEAYTPANRLRELRASSAFDKGQCAPRTTNTAQPQTRRRTATRV